MIDFTYLKQPPKKYTFEQPKLKEWVECWCIGKVLNLFAGRVELNINEIRNDIDTDMPADFHMDGYDFIYKAVQIGMEFDTVVFTLPTIYEKAGRSMKVDG